jgi:two-component system, NtrC family, response regulator AtoC
VHEVAADFAGDTIRYGYLPPEEVILGRSAAMSEVRDKLERVACTDIPVLIRGEAGSGKEILARLIHSRYPGETTPFHKVTPAGRDGWRKSASFVIPRDETNGNGHHHHSVPGRPACIGSLFFEEIAELNFVSQRKLAHLLHGDRLPDNGATEYAPSLLRMICSTRHDIEREMRLGNFRQDLFYSINTVSLRLPPLRSRSEDIPGLARHFWECYRNEFGSDAPSPSFRLIEALVSYDWPGNIREFANVMKRYALLGSEEKIVGDLAARACQPAARETAAARGVSLKSLARQQAQEVERGLILRTLRETQWNRKRAAHALNISYRSLLYKIKEAGLPPKRVFVKRERQT